jgi:hypothetical protein
MAGPNAFYMPFSLYPSLNNLRARIVAEKAHFLADEAMDILDDDSNDVITQDDGKQTPNMTAVRRAESRAEHRRWLASRYNPTSYGDKQQIAMRSTSVVVTATPEDLRSATGSLDNLMG